MASSDNPNDSTTASSAPNHGQNLSQGSALVEDDGVPEVQVPMQQQQQDDEVSPMEDAITTSAVDTTTVAFVLEAMPSKPSLLTPPPLRESKNKKWEVDAPVSAKVNKAGITYLNKANLNIGKLENALSMERTYGDSVLKEAKGVITTMHGNMTKMHTKLKNTLVEVAKLTKNVSDLTVENKTQTEKLKSVTTENKNLKEKLVKAQKDIDGLQRKVNDSKKTKAVAAAKPVKSPTTLSREKSELRIEEHRKKEQTKAEIEMKKKEHDAKIRQQRQAQVGGLFSVDNSGAFSRNQGYDKKHKKKHSHKSKSKRHKHGKKHRRRSASPSSSSSSDSSSESSSSDSSVDSYELKRIRKEMKRKRKEEKRRRKEERKRAKQDDNENRDKDVPEVSEGLPRQLEYGSSPSKTNTTAEFSIGSGIDLDDSDKLYTPRHLDV